MLLGEITPGGAGAGLYGMLVFAILSVFIAGLMVGRTPEYLGKKIEPFEMKMAMIVVLILATSVLGYTAYGTLIEPGEPGGPGNAGPHGFSEILYAFASQTGNNGSAFGSLTGNTPFYNVAGGFAMLIGRWGMIIPILAIAGSMAAKRRVAPSLGTFPTTGPLFVGLLIGVVLIVGALTYFPALALGPIVEQLLLNAGAPSDVRLQGSLRSRPRDAPLPALRRPRRAQARGGAEREGARHPRPGAAARRDPRGIPQARSARPPAQPGDLRRGDHGGARDPAPRAERDRRRAGRRGRPASGSRSRSLSGCG